MTDNHQHSDNAAWRAAQQWRERVQQTRPSQRTSGLRLLFTWLLFGIMLIVGTFLGLFFLVIGWAMLPFVRHRMKKRAEQFRASQAQYAGGTADHDGAHAGNTHSAGRSQRVLDGEYEVKNHR
ncbi:MULTISPECIES: hypothetical protein [Salinicola]|uniref:Uncharacterized protein n=1 Tax=Salinicola socius TaxID=404433 RepID=A0A1Q8STC8_9GAMM|nr:MULTISPECIES: hypothetical protein [Salinicola]OLO04705.1 hypothetical protein BTW07_07860 [Salinicola socius]